MKAALTPLALALLIAAPAYAQTAQDDYNMSNGTTSTNAPTDNSSSSYRNSTTSDTGSSTSGSSMSNSPTGTSSSSSVSTSSDTAVDMTIRDLQSAKSNLNNAASDRSRSKIMKEIDTALKDLEGMKSRSSK
jgi:hypothetical protein